MVGASSFFLFSFSAYSGNRQLGLLENKRRRRMAEKGFFLSFFLTNEDMKQKDLQEGYISFSGASA